MLFKNGKSWWEKEWGLTKHVLILLRNVSTVTLLLPNRDDFGVQ